MINDIFPGSSTHPKVVFREVLHLIELEFEVDMQPIIVVLSTYTGKTVRPLGEAYVKVEYSRLQHSLLLLVVQEGTLLCLDETGS